MKSPEDRFFEMIEGKTPVLRVRALENPPSVAVMMIWPQRHDTGAAVHLTPEQTRVVAHGMLRYADEVELILTKLN